MNIYTQCCGLVILVVLSIFYKRQKVVALSTERVFWSFFCATFVCITLDIVSVFAIVNQDNIPSFFQNLICKSYLVSIVVVTTFGLAYICVEIYTIGEAYRRVMKRAIVCCSLGCVVIYALPLYYFYDDTSGILYSYGPSAIATYIVTVGILIFSILLTILHKHSMNKKRREAIQIWIVAWFIAAIFQFLMPQYLVVGFAAAIGTLVLYIKFENPENNIERMTGYFNQKALFQYIKELTHNGRDFSLLAMELNQRIDEKLREEILGFINKISRVTLFALSEDEIVFLFCDKQYAENTVKALRNRFEAGWGTGASVMLQPHWIYMENAGCLKDERDFFYLLERIKSDEVYYSSNHFLKIDDEAIQMMYSEKEREQLLAEALEMDRVEVYLQPIYSVKEKRITSAEALVRIRNAQGIIVYPAEFIEIAERNNMILKLGKIVFEKVCIFIQQNNMEELGLKNIDINLSVIQCGYQNLAQEFIEIMEKHHVNSKYINLEITETASANAKKKLLENMKKLIEYGVEFSLDDFGTGQSNLDYMLDMPVGIIKFDRQLTNAYFESGKAKYVIEAVMQMIRGMNLKTISEGIETKEQLEMMEKLGMDYIQGYYFSRPVSEKDFVNYVKNWKNNE